MSSGLSFINYADYCTISNLQVTASSGTLPAVSILSGSLASLQTRRLSESVRIQLVGGTATTPVVSFDVTLPTSAPNDLGYTNALNVGMFGLFGLNIVSIAGAVPYTWPDVRYRLRGYAANPVSGTAVWDTGIGYFGTYASQDDTETAIMVPVAIRAAAPMQVTRCLLDSDGAKTMYYPSQGWNAWHLNNLKSFRVDVIFSYAAASPLIFELGRLWLGNRFAPIHGAASTTENISDTSIVTLSRSGQAFPAYFNRARALSITYPGLYEAEAHGGGHTISNRASPPFPVSTANCYQMAQYCVGTSKELVFTLRDGTDLSTPAKANEIARQAMYGRATAWQNLGLVPARKTPDASAGSGVGAPARLYTGGLTTVEER